MTHLLRLTPHPCRPALAGGRQSLCRMLILLPLAGLLLALTSCEEEVARKPPPVPVTDTKPVGDGLSVIGYALLGAAVVVVAGRLIR